MQNILKKHVLMTSFLFYCSGRLMRDRSQSSFSVSYKNMKKSPSLQSLDNISIDSYLMEDGDTYSLQERGSKDFSLSFLANSRRLLSLDGFPFYPLGGSLALKKAK